MQHPHPLENDNCIQDKMTMYLYKRVIQIIQKTYVYFFFPIFPGLAEAKMADSPTVTVSSLSWHSLASFCAIIIVLKCSVLKITVWPSATIKQ